MSNGRLCTNGSIRRVARQLIDLSDTKRKDLLTTFDTETRIKIIERMTQIKIERMRQKNDPQCR